MSEAQFSMPDRVSGLSGNAPESDLLDAMEFDLTMGDSDPDDVHQSHSNNARNIQVGGWCWLEVFKADESHEFEMELSDESFTLSHGEAEEVPQQSVSSDREVVIPVVRQNRAITRASAALDEVSLEVICREGHWP